jgi:hypothetical protein
MNADSSLFSLLRRWLMSLANRCDCGFRLTPFEDGMECERCLRTYEAKP